MHIGSEPEDAFILDPYSLEFRDVVYGALERERSSCRVRADLATTVQEVLNRILVASYRPDGTRDCSRQRSLRSFETLVDVLLGVAVADV
jgi:hypothetical protein